MYRKTFSQSFLRTIIALSAAAVLSVGFGPCALSVNEICADHLREFERRTDDAVLAVRALRLPDRAVASVESDSSEAGLDSVIWQEWAESRLREVQHYMDVVEDEAGLALVRVELSRMADRLVEFHGYAHLSRIDQMAATLDKIREGAAVTRNMTCKPVP